MNYNDSITIGDITVMVALLGKNVFSDPFFDEYSSRLDKVDA